jgi:poly-gamma-glutamate synthesis protein (capsule biosynthesis protein)
MMYFADVDAVSGDLAALEMVPLQIRQFRLIRASGRDVDWLRDTLDRESRGFGSAVVPGSAGRLALSWPEQGAPANALVR